MNRLRRGTPSVVRRSALLLVAAAVTGCGSSSQARGDPSDPTETFREPPVVASRNGVLQTSLTPALSTVSVGGRQASLMVYNGLYIPQTLRVRPGDTIRLRFVNRLTEQSNLHTHGLSVSPRGNSDNMFRSIAPGQTEDYEFRLPADHPSGLFWYHPHPHTLSDVQTRNGMSGAVIVDGLLDSIPTLRQVPERLLLLKDLQLDSGHAVIESIGKNTVRTVNGIVNPLIVLRPGATELWRIGNIGADLYYSLRLDGHRFTLVARDGNRRARLTDSDTLRLSPGARAEVW